MRLVKDEAIPLRIVWPVGRDIYSAQDANLRLERVSPRVRLLCDKFDEMCLPHG